MPTIEMMTEEEVKDLKTKGNGTFKDTYLPHFEKIAVGQVLKIAYEEATDEDGGALTGKDLISARDKQRAALKAAISNARIAKKLPAANVLKLEVRQLEDSSVDYFVVKCTASANKAGNKAPTGGKVR
jgi:hypothetical protein